MNLLTTEVVCSHCIACNANQAQCQSLPSLTHSDTVTTDKHMLVHVGYLEASASQPEDRAVLTKLFGLCLAGDAALHARLIEALIDLSAVEAECRGVGTSATLGPDQPVLANVVAETICGIKIQVRWFLLPIQLRVCKSVCRDVLWHDALYSNLG